MIHLKLIAFFSLLPPLVMAQTDAGVSARPKEADEAQRRWDHAREMREHSRELREQAREQARELRELSREQMNMVKDQMRDVNRQMREIAREQRAQKLYPRLGVVVRSETGSGDAAKGVVVQEMTAGAPAQKAGIQVGDILTAVNGQSLVEPADASVQSAAHAVAKLMALLYASKKGEKVKIDYLRGSEKRQAEVELEGGLVGTPFRLPALWMDVELVSINRDLGEYFGTDHGLLVVRGSTKGDLKLKGGDVILRIGDRQPETPLDAVRLLRSYDGKAIPVEILRHKKNEKLTIQVSR